MAKQITVILDDDVAEILPELAGGESRQGAYLSALIRAASENRAVATATDLEALRLQVGGLANELQSVKSRLLTLETVDE
ncbi:MAG: hypothetical protein ACR2M0_04580 [Chloroflexia bacterium]